MNSSTQTTVPDIHSNSVADLATQLDTHIHNGLTADQVRQRLATVGDQMVLRPIVNWL